MLIQLSQNDTDSIKENPPFCLHYTSCYITITSDFGTDVQTFSSKAGPYYRNKNIPVLALRHPRGTLIHDRVPPRLTGFSVDFNLQRLILTFNEVVQGQLINPRGIQLRSKASLGPHTYSVNMTSETFGIEDIASTVHVQLSYHDYIKIQLTGGNTVADGFATVDENSFVYLEGLTVMDVAGNYLVPGPAMMSQRFIDDASLPTLDAFTYDPLSYNLTMYFSKVRVCGVNMCVCVCVWVVVVCVGTARARHVIMSCVRRVLTMCPTCPMCPTCRPCNCSRSTSRRSCCFPPSTRPRRSRRRTPRRRCCSRAATS